MPFYQLPPTNPPKRKRPGQGVPRLFQFDESDPFYKSVEWQKLRAKFLTLNGGRVCRGKDHVGDRQVESIVVDHVVERRDDRKRELDITNLQALCSSCHQLKTQSVNRARRTREHWLRRARESEQRYTKPQARSISVPGTETIYEWPDHQWRTTKPPGYE